MHQVAAAIDQRHLQVRHFPPLNALFKRFCYIGFDLLLRLAPYLVDTHLRRIDQTAAARSRLNEIFDNGPTGFGHRIRFGAVSRLFRRFFIYDGRLAKNGIYAKTSAQNFRDDLRLYDPHNLEVQFALLGKALKAEVRVFAGELLQRFF